MEFGSRSRGDTLGSENFRGWSASLRCAMPVVSESLRSSGTVVPARRLMLERPLSFVVAAVAEAERSIIFITLFSSLGVPDDEEDNEEDVIEPLVFDVIECAPPLPLVVVSSGVSSSKVPALFFLPSFGLDGMMIGEGREVAALSRVAGESGEDGLLSSFIPFFVAADPTLGEGPNKILSWLRIGLLGGVFVTKGRRESPEGRAS